MNRLAGMTLASVFAAAIAALASAAPAIGQDIELKRVARYAGPEHATTPVARYCRNPYPDSGQDKHRDVAVGRGGRALSPSPFLNAKVLRIEIDASSSTCGPQCRQAIEHAVATGFGLWRSGCSRCRSNSLNVIVINGSVWVDTVTLDKWRFALDSGRTAPDRDPYGANRVNLRPFGFQPVTDFRRVNDIGLRDRICSRRSAIDIPAAVEDVVCASAPSDVACGTDCMRIEVHLGSARAHCSLGGDVIACGSPDSDISLNTDDFVFEHDMDAPTRTRVVFGHGVDRAPLLFVMIHEMGHWFGLPHDDEDADRVSGPLNVMTDGYQRARPWCVTEWNLVQMDNAVDLQWDARLGAGAGLRYRR